MNNNKNKTSNESSKNNKNKNNNKMGFTLIELLVVVLIIGILAAIALPQYKKIVIRSKFATLKENTESLVKAADRYFLTHNEFPTSLNDLDIEVGTMQSNGVYTDLPDRSVCFRTSPTSTYQDYGCMKLIFGKTMRYEVRTTTTGRKNRMCLPYSTDTSDVYNQVCQQETGKSAPSASSERYNVYLY